MHISYTRHRRHPCARCGGPLYWSYWGTRTRAARGFRCSRCTRPEQECVCPPLRAPRK